MTGSGRYADLLTDTARLPIPPVSYPPIPERPAVTPGTVKAGTGERDSEPLVPIRHPRIRSLEAYRHAGWEQARPGSLLRSGALTRLAAAADALPGGFGLAVLDAWRPLELQRALHDAAYADLSLPPGFVADPDSSPEQPPPHLTGGTVDLTLTWHGEALALGTAFDDFTPAAAVRAFETTAGPVRDLRRLLYWVMRREGFVVDRLEWWHYEIGTRTWAAHTGEAVWYSAAAAPI